MTKDRCRVRRPICAQGNQFEAEETNLRPRTPICAKNIFGFHGNKDCKQAVVLGSRVSTCLNSEVINTQENKLARKKFEEKSKKDPTSNLRDCFQIGPWPQIGPLGTIFVHLAPDWSPCPRLIFLALKSVFYHAQTHPFTHRCTHTHTHTHSIHNTVQQNKTQTNRHKHCPRLVQCAGWVAVGTAFPIALDYFAHPNTHTPHNTPHDTYRVAYNTQLIFWRFSQANTGSRRPISFQSKETNMDPRRPIQETSEVIWK